MRALLAAAAVAGAAPLCGGSSNMRVGAWREYNPAKKHAHHQTSDLKRVGVGYRAGISPYQRIPLEPRVPDDLPPYAPTASTPECVEVFQAGRSLSARNQEETCADWALGRYWMAEEMHGDRSVWRTARGTAALRFVPDDAYGWWIHRDTDRHGYACMGEGSDAVSPDPLGCTGFGHRHWSPCQVRRCAEGEDGGGGVGLEAKLRRLKTSEMRDWAQELGLQVTDVSQLAKPFAVIAVIDSACCCVLAVVTARGHGARTA